MWWSSSRDAFEDACDELAAGFAVGFGCPEVFEVFEELAGLVEVGDGSWRELGELGLDCVSAGEGSRLWRGRRVRIGLAASPRTRSSRALRDPGRPSGSAPVVVLGVVAGPLR